MREACLYNNWSFVPIFLKIYRALMRWTPWSFFGEVAVMGDDAIFTRVPATQWPVDRCVHGCPATQWPVGRCAAGRPDTDTPAHRGLLTGWPWRARSRSQLSGCTINQRCVVRGIALSSLLSCRLLAPPLDRTARLGGVHSWRPGASYGQCAAGAQGGVSKSISYNIYCRIPTSIRYIFVTTCIKIIDNTLKFIKCQLLVILRRNMAEQVMPCMLPCSSVR